jgi:hypothetical protein
MAVRLVYFHITLRSRRGVVDADLSDYFTAIPHPTRHNGRALQSLTCWRTCAPSRRLSTMKAEPVNSADVTMARPGSNYRSMSEAEIDREKPADRRQLCGLVLYDPLSSVKHRLSRSIDPNRACATPRSIQRRSRAVGDLSHAPRLQDSREPKWIAADPLGLAIGYPFDDRLSCF